MFRLEVGSAFDRAVLVNVSDDFGGLFGRVAELGQSLWNGVVDNLDESAADELLVLDERKIGLDTGGVAIHHETDGSGVSENRDLGILETVLFAEGQSFVP